MIQHSVSHEADFVRRILLEPSGFTNRRLYVMARSPRFVVNHRGDVGVGGGAYLISRITLKLQNACKNNSPR